MPDGNRDVEHQVIISPPRPMRATGIKNLIPQLPERGKVKIGAKGRMITSRQGNQFQPPVKLDHFRITTLQRGEDGNLDRDEAVHQRLGDKPTEIPVRLLYDEPDLNFLTRYAAFVGRTLWCSGDGVTASRLTRDGKDRFELPCPCHLSDPSYQPNRGDPPRCKMNGALSVIIDGASGLGGVWKFRTTSYNSITGIMGAMVFIRQITGGPLANIPLKLRIQPKQATAPTDGSPVLIYIVSLEFDGDISALQQIAHQIALDRARTHVSIAEIETEARRMLALAAPANAPLPGDEPEDIVAEFYPEQMTEDDATPPPRPHRRDFVETKGPDTELEEPFALALADGSERLFVKADDAAQALDAELRTRAKDLGVAGVESAWIDNAALISELRSAGRDDLADRLHATRNELASEHSSSGASVPGHAEYPEGEVSRNTPSHTAERNEQEGLFGEASAHHPARHQDDARPRDTVPPFAVGVQEKPGGRGTDWIATKDALLARARKITDQAQFAEFHRANAETRKSLRDANKQLWSDCNFELSNIERELRESGR